MSFSCKRCGGNPPEKGDRSKKGTIGCHPRGRHHVFTHFPKDPMCEVCRKTPATWATWKVKLKNRVGGIAFSSQFGDFIKADQKILNVDNESRCGHKKYSKRARGLHELGSQLSGDNKGCVGYHVVFTKIPTFPLKKRERVNTDNATVLIEAGQVLQWNHDTSAPHHSETIGVSEKAISEWKKEQQSH